MTYGESVSHRGIAWTGDDVYYMFSYGSSKQLSISNKRTYTRLFTTHLFFFYLGLRPTAHFKLTNLFLPELYFLHLSSKYFLFRHMCFLVT
jgi:hypothetical protein